MVDSLKIEASSYKAYMSIGICFNILSIIDMICLTYFMDSTAWIATGMTIVFNQYYSEVCFYFDILKEISIINF